MKVHITPAAGASVEIITKDGRKLDNSHVKSICFEPFFTHSSGAGEIFHSDAKAGDDDHVVDRISLLVGGATGKMTIRKRPDKSAVPLIDKKKINAGAAA